jgi:hypothetical protein
MRRSGELNSLFRKGMTMQPTHIKFQSEQHHQLNKKKASS